MSANSIECLTSDVSLGGLLLNHRDADGCDWRLGNIEGWWTLPETEFADIPRSWDDGSYDTAARYTARNITITGIIMPPHPRLIPAARARLHYEIDLARRNTWLITRETGRTVGSVVRLSGQPLIDTVSQSGRTDFAIGLRAPDPVKYSLKDDEPPGWYEETQVGPNSKFVTNEGNYQVFPTFTIVGPTAGPVRVSNVTTDKHLVVQSLIPSGSELVVDVKNRAVSLDGNRNKRNYLRWDTDWPMLLPDVNEIEFAPYESATTPAAADEAELRVQWRHGWIA